MHYTLRAEIRREISQAVGVAICKAFEGPQLRGVPVIIEKIEVFINSPRGAGATVNTYDGGRKVPELEDRRVNGVKDRRRSC